MRLLYAVIDHVAQHAGVLIEVDDELLLSGHVLIIIFGNRVSVMEEQISLGGQLDLDVLYLILADSAL